jgi:hypothetical protein
VRKGEEERSRTGISQLIPYWRMPSRLRLLNDHQGYMGITYIEEERVAQTQRA